MQIIQVQRRRVGGGTRQQPHWFAYALLLLGIASSQILLIRLGTFTVGDLLLIAAVVIVGAKELLNNGMVRPTSLFLAILILVAAALASVNAFSPVESLVVGLRLVLLAVLVPGLAAVVLVNRTRIVYALLALGVGGAISGAVGFVQLLAPAIVIPGAMATNSGRYSGLTGHVSDQGGVTSVAIVALVGALLLGQRQQRVIGVIALPFALFGLVLSGSVSGMLAVVFSFVVLVTTRTMRLRYLFAMLIVGIPALIAALEVQSRSSVALDPIQRLLVTLGEADGYGTGVSSSESRIDTYGIAIRRWVDAGFMGNGLDPVSATVVGSYPAHNFLIAAAFSGGVLTLLALVIATTRSFLGRWIHPRRDPLTGVLLTVGLAAIFFAMTAPSLYNRYMWVPLAIVYGGRMLSAGKASEIESSAPVSPKR